MNTLDEAQVKAAATYNAAADFYDAAANSFWDRFGRRTVDRTLMQRFAYSASSSSPTWPPQFESCGSSSGLGVNSPSRHGGRTSSNLETPPSGMPYATSLPTFTRASTPGTALAIRALCAGFLGRQGLTRPRWSPRLGSTRSRHPRLGGPPSSVRATEARSRNSMPRAASTSARQTSDSSATKAFGRYKPMLSTRSPRSLLDPAAVAERPMRLTAFAKARGKYRHVSHTLGPDL